MRLTRVRLALGLLAAAVAASVWISMSTPASLRTTTADGIDATAGAVASVPAPPDVAAWPPPAGGAVPHPARDAPLAQVWSTLLAPAQAGDAGAACRLAIETLRCVGSLWLTEAGNARARGHHGELQVLRAFEASPSSFGRREDSNDSPNRAALDEWQQRARDRQARCEGLTRERAEQAIALLRVAALAGHPDAQAVYASGESWFLTLPGGMASPTFDQWRREAPLIVARMLDAGHPDAPGLLAGPYSHQTWLAGLYDYDLERASAFLILNTRLMGKPELADQQLRDVASDVRARARQQADALYARHYAGRATEDAKFWLGAGTRIAQPDYSGRGNLPTPCERTPTTP